MKMAATLEVYKNTELIFSSTGKWLHPLFDLEEFLSSKHLSPENLLIRDKIVGKASAMLIFRLGFRTVEAGTLSLPAKEFFSKTEISFTCNKLVDLIDCRTETMLEKIDDPEKAYLILKERAKK